MEDERGQGDVGLVAPAVEIPRGKPVSAPVFPPKVPKKRRIPPKVLRDMRFVYRHAKEHDRTDGHKRLREFMEKTPQKFLAMLTDQEKAWNQAKHKGDARVGGRQEAPAGAAAPIAADAPPVLAESDEEILDGLESMLKEYEGE